jgi:hypothetical protein
MTRAARAIPPCPAARPVLTPGRAYASGTVDIRGLPLYQMRNCVESVRLPERKADAKLDHGRGTSQAR